MAQDEQDILPCTIRHLLAQGIDRVLVADNLSSDSTPRLLSSLAETGKVYVLRDNLEPYWQSEKNDKPFENCHRARRVVDHPV